MWSPLLAAVAVPSGGKKKVGGVRVRAVVRSSPGAVAPKPKKKVGGVVAVEQGTTVGHPQCDQCPGEYHDGMWVHSRYCVNMVTRWDAHDIGSPWDCWYGCPGVRMATATTHTWDCVFWSSEAGRLLTPFGIRRN